MTARTVLIASGAYVEPELQAQFGTLPPAFLPLGNRRLFWHQHAALKNCAESFLLTVPEDFVPDPTDAALLETLGIQMVPVPVGLTLGQSLVYAINVTRSVGQPLIILHGDTLALGAELDEHDFFLAKSDAPPEYRWAYIEQGEGGRATIVQDATDSASASRLALTGLFGIHDTGLLVQMITRAGGDFVAGIGAYAVARPVKVRTAGEWLDFGHAGTYYRARRRITTQREFNRLDATRRAVVKSGSKPDKIEAEALWFEGLPPALRAFAPAYLGRRTTDTGMSYALEYLHLPTLSDLYVFGRLGPAAWERIFDGCDEFLSLLAQETPAATEPEPAGGLYLEKTLERLEVFAAASGLDLDEPCRFNGAWLPSLRRMAMMASGAIAAEHPVTLTHGDFCFSNVLYDARADMVKAIDPRGLDQKGRFSTFGDLRYDIGKLYHSVIGRYDHIIAGYRRMHRLGALDFELELGDTPALLAIERAFLRQRFAGMTPERAAAPAITTLLFFSMLPLHADDPDRQWALLANGMRLFLDLDRTGGRVAA